MGWAAKDDDLKKKKFPEEDEDDDDDWDGSEASGHASSHPPDGGYGWVVLLASFVCNVIVDGIGFSFGAAQVHYMEVFNASFLEVSWVGSSLTGSYLIVGPIVGLLCCRLGLRTVTIMGSILASIGFILSSFSINLTMLIFTYGIIGGTGLGMMYLPSIVCVNYWFEKKLGFATGIAVCGSGLGQYVFLPLGEYLVSEYQWQGKHLILGAIVLNGAVCGALFRCPDRWHHRRRKRCNQRVEIERGIIMKALIEDKKRQRTISDGSLDNCVITTKNCLIKLDTKLMDCNESKSLRKMLRQLGFSIQSLAVSKHSLQPNERVLFEALQQSKLDLENSSMSSKTNSAQFLQPGAQLQKRNSSPDFNKVSSDHEQANGGVLRSNSVISNGQLDDINGSGLIPNGVTSDNTNSPIRGFKKTKSCASLSQQPREIMRKLLVERVRSNSETVTAHSPNNLPPTHIFPLGSSPTLPVGSVDVSIQEIPPSEFDTSCYNSSTSIATDISGQFAHEYVPNSSQNGLVTSGMISGAQLEASLKLLKRDKHRANSVLWRLWQMVVDMVKLMLNPMLGLFLVSSLFTLLAFYIPYYHVPTLGLDIGMTVVESEYLLFLLAVMSTIGRIIVGWLGDRPVVNTLYLNNGALICAGICIFSLPFFKSPSALCILTAVLGICLAVFVALRSLLLVKYLGVELFPKSFGLLCLFQGIAAFAGAPLAGSLVDGTGSLDLTFYVAGIFTFISGLILFPLNYLKKREDMLAAQRLDDEEAEGDCSTVESIIETIPRNVCQP